MNYAWNRPRSVDAQTFGKVIEGISERHGGLCPTWAVVDEARPERSVLHRMFEWDDPTAAEAYRRDQARHHLRELRVVKMTEEGEEEVQALVHIVRLEDDRRVEGYRLTSLVVRHTDEYEQMLGEAKSGLRAWQRRWKHLSDLREVFDFIDDFV